MPDLTTSPTAGAPGSEPPTEPRGPRKITCEFCESSLTPTGDMLKMSDRAKSLRDLEMKVQKLEREKTELEGTIQTLRDEAERRGAPAPAPASGEDAPGSPVARKHFLFHQSSSGS